MRFAAALIWSSLVGFLCGMPAHAEKRVAIVVGINDYDNLKADQQLQKAIDDAKAVGDAFAALGFDVVRGENLRRPEFNRLWQHFLNQIEPGDVAAFFFAGHGVEIGGANFLLARDVPPIASGEDELLKSESIRLARLIDDVRSRKPKVSLLILDACRDNPFPQEGRSVGATRGLARVEAPEGTFVMFSAGTGETALDRLGDADADANSVYTRRLVPLMRQPGLSLPDLAQELRRQVREVAAGAHHRQTPAYYDEVVGRFCLAGCDGGVAVAALPPIPPPTPQIAAPPPRIDPPNEPLPADIRIDPDLLRLVETHPFFANAPAVKARRYNVAWRSVDKTVTNTSNDETTLRWMRERITRSDVTQQMTSISGGSTTKGTVQTTSINADGFLSLGYRGTGTQRVPRLGTVTTKSTSRLLRIENLRGKRFPIEVGNRFSYRATYQTKTTSNYGNDSDETTYDNSCEVAKRYEANHFHPDLTGAAYLIVCDVQTTYRKNTAANSNSTSREIYFDALGTSFMADPMSPYERIISVGGQFDAKYALKSFALAH